MAAWREPGAESICVALMDFEKTGDYASDLRALGLTNARAGGRTNCARAEAGLKRNPEEAQEREKELARVAYCD